MNKNTANSTIPCPNCAYPVACVRPVCPRCGTWLVEHGCGSCSGCSAQTNTQRSRRERTGPANI